MKANHTNLISSIDALERDITKRITNLKEQAEALRHIHDHYRQTTLALQVDDSIRKEVEVFITSRNFKSYQDFDVWARKVGASTVTKLCYEFTGINIPYRDLKKIAQEAYYNIQVVEK